MARRGEEEEEDDDEYAKLVRRTNPPRVVIDNDSCENATVIRVDRVKKHGILLEAVQVLVDLDLVITKAYISSDGNWFMDVFDVTDQYGNKLESMETIEHIQRCLESEDCIVPPAIGPADGVSPSDDQSTCIELTGTDRPGLLSEVCAVLASLSCNIVKAEVWTHDRRAAAVVQITDEATGLAVGDRARLSKVQELLCNVMQGDGSSTRGGVARKGLARGDAPAQADARRRRRRRAGGYRRRRGEERQGEAQGQGQGLGHGLHGEELHGGDPAVRRPAEAAVRHAVRAHRPAVRRLPLHGRRRGRRRGLPGVLRPARRRAAGALRRRADPPRPVPRGRRREARVPIWAGAGDEDGGQGGAPVGDHARVPGEQPIHRPRGDLDKGRRGGGHVLRVGRARQPRRRRGGGRGAGAGGARHAEGEARRGQRGRQARRRGQRRVHPRQPAQGLVPGAQAHQILLFKSHRGTDLFPTN